MARWIAALAVAAGLAAPGSALAAETTKLETNAAATPLGIDDAKPKLSWRLEGAERGLKQTRYRIVVATTAARAAAGDGNVWDSGEVASANPYAEYSGPALASRTRYHWAVRTDATGWSAPSWFETAYLTPVRVEGHLDLRPGAHADAAHERPGRRRRRLLHPGQHDPVHAPRAPATGSCASPASPGSPRARPSRSATTPRPPRSRASARRPGTRPRCSPRAAGDTNVKVASVTNFAAGAPLTIGTQTVTITTVGTAAGAATTLFAPAAAGDTNVKTTSVNGFTAGQPALIDGEIRTVTTVGTQGRATTLAAAAAAGDTNVKVASVTGFGVGDTLIVGTRVAGRSRPSAPRAPPAPA